MPNLKNRMIFDVLLTVMLVFEMLYQFTGNTLHEIVGFAFFACIVAHLVFARRWIGATASSIGKKKMNRHRKGLAVMALLLLVDVVVLGISSIVISNTLWNMGINLSALNPGEVWYPLHTASAYGLCGLVLVHLAMHWTSVARVFRIEYDPGRRRAIGQCVGAAVGVGALALGFVGATQVGKSVFETMASTIGDDSDAGSGAQAENAAGSSTGSSGSRSTSDGAGSGQGLRESRGHGPGHGGGKHGWESESSTGGSAPSGDSATGGSAEGGSNSGSSDTSSGICTLCREQCSLSSPRCNRPYEQGLL